MSTLKILCTGEVVKVQLIRKEHAIHLGLEFSPRYVVLFVKRPRTKPHICVPLAIELGSLVRITGEGKQGHIESIDVRVAEFLPIRRYRSQKIVDTGYVICPAFESPQISVMKFDSVSIIPQ
jgi:hypothetical protein